MRTKLLLKTFVKIWKNWTPEKIAVIILKFEWDGFYHTALRPKDADTIANSVSFWLEAVWSGSTQCVPNPASEKLGSLR